jgi:hypothetical protein
LNQSVDHSPMGEPYFESGFPEFHRRKGSICGRYPAS